MKKIIRKILPILFVLKIDRLLAYITARKGCIILCFHGIGEGDKRFLSTNQFNAIQYYLHKYFKDRYLNTYDDGYEGYIPIYDTGIHFLNTAYIGIDGYQSPEFERTGSHSHNHVYLNYCQPDLIKKELIESYQTMPTPYLAFPFGAYNDEVKKIAKEVGYKYLFGCECKDDDVYPRFVISNKTTYESNILRMLFLWKKYAIQYLPD